MEMAREAGMSFTELFGAQRIIDGWLADLERFEALVRADEREALCKLMEDQNTWDLYDPNATAIEIIRARGQA
jgi:hypothetical protein